MSLATVGEKPKQKRERKLTVVLQCLSARTVSTRGELRYAVVRIKPVSGSSMYIDDVAQVPELDHQLLLNSSSSVSGLPRHSGERSLFNKQDRMNPHPFSQYNQAPHLVQDVNPSSLQGMPQHFLPGVSDISSGAFPVGMFAPLQSVPSNVAQTDKPTAAQAAAGRLQRASARQAAKAAQQQKRQAQARASAASKTEGAGSRRKREDDGAVEEAERDDSDDEEESDDDATVPSGEKVEKQPKPHEIAKTKYNHIEDEKERKRLKRLLRNRVSAQQARERKKAYMSTLEDERRAFQAKMTEMEAKINTLERENFMLRQVVKNATQGKNSEMGNEKIGLSLGGDESRAVPSH